MMTLRYGVVGLRLNGSAAPGQQVVRVLVRHLQLARAAKVTGATVSVSFDGGKTSAGRPDDRPRRQLRGGLPRSARRPGNATDQRVGCSRRVRHRDHHPRLPCRLLNKRRSRARAILGGSGTPPERVVMDSDALRAVQKPLKDAYRENPRQALITLAAQGQLGEESVSCSVATGQALAVAGLHPATGGDGSLACSGDMLLQALVACAGVTLRAVATSLEIPIAGGAVRAEGDLDFRGTLGVSKDAPVGFTAIRLGFELDTEATAEQLDTLLRLTERYCVVYQSLANPVADQGHDHCPARHSSPNGYRPDQHRQDRHDAASQGSRHRRGRRGTPGRTTRSPTWPGSASGTPR